MWRCEESVVVVRRKPRAVSVDRARRENAFASRGFLATHPMTVHPAVLRKMDLEAGRAVVRTIPVAALVPAKMLVDQAVHIVGRHAVVRPRGFFPRTQDGPVRPPPPSSSLPAARSSHRPRSRLLRRRSNFPGASA